MATLWQPWQIPGQVSPVPVLFPTPDSCTVHIPPKDPFPEDPLCGTIMPVHEGRALPQGAFD